jgi:hypothetical protein
LSTRPSSTAPSFCRPTDGHDGSGPRPAERGQRAAQPFSRRCAIW